MDKDAVSWVPAADDVVGNGVITDESELAGRVAHHPLRAGQPLRAIDVERPIVVTKNKLVTIVYDTKIIRLTVRGKALENGGEHDVIRVANANSKSTVLAEVIDANTVQVLPQQIAIR
jgi:flagella basal body P-ring formation protein FlgA